MGWKKKQKPDEQAALASDAPPNAVKTTTASLFIQQCGRDAAVLVGKVGGGNIT